MRVEAESLGALARLKHPNIVAVTDFAVTPRGLPFLVMERLYGRTLAEERRRRGALPVAEAVEIAEQTLRGLSAVHRLGLLHRDIKPTEPTVRSAASIAMARGAWRRRVLVALGALGWAVLLGLLTWALRSR